MSARQVPAGGALTVFCIPKPFDGHFGVIQRNAIQSWLALTPTPDVILLGNEPGVAEAAAEFGIRHVAEVMCNEWGTPLIDDVFRQAQRHGTHSLFCYVNADIILTQSLVDATVIAARRWDRFLLSGQRTNLEIREPIRFDSAWQEWLATRAEHATLFTAFGMDYFVFPRGLWPSIPPFAVGRACWDNWMIYAAKASGAAVIDATPRVLAVHQDHSYAHIGHSADGRDWSYAGPEAERNRELAGGWAFVFSLADANWTMRGNRLVPTIAPRYLVRRLIGPLARVRSLVRPRSRLKALLRFLAGTPRPRSSNPGA